MRQRAAKMPVEYLAETLAETMVYYGSHVRTRFGEKTKRPKCDVMTYLT